MSDSRRQGTILLISIAVLVLFAVSTVIADPAAGAVLASDLEAVTAEPRPDGDPSRVLLDATGDLAVAPDDGHWEFIARPLGPVKGLTVGGGARGGFLNTCLIDFNEPSILLSLPNQAIDTFAYWPFWNQYCPDYTDTAVAVEPVGYSHYHLNYVDVTIRWCFDLGTLGKPVDPDDPLSDCTPIDPLTEPRSGVQTHLPDYSVRILAHHIPTDDRVTFDLNQIRILSGQAEVCFVKTDLPWITSKPTDDPPGYCGDLGPGNWDISESVVDAHEVRIYARSANMSFTDLGINTQ